MEEIWKEIDTYEGLCKARNQGNVQRMQKRSVKTVLSWVYSDCSHLFLPRKKEKFTEWYKEKYLWQH